MAIENVRWLEYKCNCIYKNPQKDYEKIPTTWIEWHGSQIVDPNTNPFSEEWRYSEISQLYIVHPVVTAWIIINSVYHCDSRVCQSTLNPVFVSNITEVKANAWQIMVAIKRSGIYAPAEFKRKILLCDTLYLVLWIVRPIITNTVALRIKVNFH